jgi:uncharacterized membrane protein
VTISTDCWIRYFAMIERIKLSLSAVWSLYISLFPWSVGLTLVLIISVTIGISTCQTTSKLEQKADEANTNATISNTQTNVQERVVEQAEESVEQTEKTSEKARKEREKAKQTNTTNTSYEAANSERCKTFPDSPDCR